jgi:hypothetical protein
MSGAGLSTKGLVSGGGGSVAPPVPAPLPPEAGSTNPIAESPTGSVVIVVPTATNFMLMSVENIVANLRVRQDANLVLPSLYKRAYLVAYETDEIAVVKP